MSGAPMTRLDPGAGLHQPRYQHGFNLLEVLIAILVLAIGLIGLAALQSVGLKSSHGAYLSSQSALLAYDMADRIRANAENAAAYVGESNCPETPADLPLAQADFDEWSCRLGELLPSGVGEVALDGDLYRITIEWVDRQGDIESPWEFELEVRL